MDVRNSYLYGGFYVAQLGLQVAVVVSVGCTSLSRNDKALCLLADGATIFRQIVALCIILPYLPPSRLLTCGLMVGLHTMPCQGTLAGCPYLGNIHLTARKDVILLLSVLLLCCGGQG